MRRHLVSGFRRALLSLSQEKSSGVEIGDGPQLLCTVHLAVLLARENGEECPFPSALANARQFASRAKTHPLPLKRRLSTIPNFLLIDYYRQFRTPGIMGNGYLFLNPNPNA